MKPLSTAIFLSCFLVTAYPSVAYGLKNDNDNTYNQKMNELEKAMEVRNFLKAKELMHDLIPIMDEDIMNSKKSLSSLKSEIEGTELERLTDNLNRKKEIRKEIHHYMNVSPSAIRARSEDVLKLVEEFKTLVLPIDEQSSN